MLYHITYMWNLIFDQMNFYIKQKTEIDSQTWETNLWLPKEKKSEGGINKDFKISRYMLQHIQQEKQGPKMAPTPVLLPRKPHGWRSLVSTGSQSPTRLSNFTSLHSTGNHIWYLVTNYNGKDYEKEYICNTEPLCLIQETNPIRNMLRLQIEREWTPVS